MRTSSLACILAMTLATAAIAQPIKLDPAASALALEVFKQLVEINTTDTPAGNVTSAAEAMAKRLRDGGFAASDMQLLGPNDRKHNLVVRLRGTGAHKPVLMIGHLDVVDAHARTGVPIRSRWSRRTAISTGVAPRI